jgi:hypothetical protein
MTFEYVAQEILIIAKATFNLIALIDAVFDGL